MRFLLASKSPARRLTLINAGITPFVLVSHVDEGAIVEALHAAGNPTPAQEVGALAAAKCRAVGGLLTSAEGAESIPDDDELLLVGCDSMLEFEGRMLGKPHTPALARERIRQMRSKEGVLWTGHYAMRLRPVPRREGGPAFAAVSEAGASASTTVRFGDMSDAEIDAYVDSGEPLKVAGSFTVDGLGGPFITSIDGDFHSVVGLSLPLTRLLAAELGVFWPDLWDHRRVAESR